MSGKRTMNRWAVQLLLSTFVALTPGLTHAESLRCLDFDGKPLAVGNAEALKFKNDHNLSLKRFRLDGSITHVLNAAVASHARASLQIGPGQTDTVEIVFSNEFGHPVFEEGQHASVCGDFIVSKEDTDRYLASPDGAIIHWLHATSSPHPAGYLVLNKKVFGDGETFETAAQMVANEIAVSPSLDVPKEAPCFELDARGILKNPNYKQPLRIGRTAYGFISDGHNIYQVEQPDDKIATLKVPEKSVWRFFRENLARREYANCGQPGGSNLNKITFAEIVTAQPTFSAVDLDTDRFKSCLNLDARGVILNPNYKNRGAPFSKTYGFVSTHDGSISGVPEQDSTIVKPYPTVPTIEHLFKKMLKDPHAIACLP